MNKLINEEVTIKKYEIIGEETVILPDDRKMVLSRIKAIRNFGNIKEGELGGLIESEKNLSQKGTCWISGDSIVCDNASIYGDASVLDKSVVIADSKIYGKTIISHVQIGDRSQISGLTYVSNSIILGVTRIGGHCSVRNANIMGSKICGNAQIKPLKHQNNDSYPNTIIFNSRIGDSVVIEGSVDISDSTISGNTKISSLIKSYGVELSSCNIMDNVVINGICNISDTRIYNNAEIDSQDSDEPIIISDSEVSDHAFIKGGIINESSISGHTSILIDKGLCPKDKIIKTDINNCSISDNTIVVNSKISNINTSGIVTIVLSKLIADDSEKSIIQGPCMIGESLKYVSSNN